MGALSTGALMAISAVGGLASATASAGINAVTTGNAMSSNSEENQKQREWASGQNYLGSAWQSLQNSLQRDWQQEMLGYTSDLEYGNWLKQFNAENAYNAPAAQVQRLREAGLNPSVLASGGVSNGAAAAQMSPIGAPSGAANGAPVLSASPLDVGRSPDMSALGNVFGGIADMLSSLASAKKQGMEVSRMEQLIPHEVVFAAAQAASQECIARGLELDNAFKSAKLSYKDNLAYQEYMSLVMKNSVMDADAQLRNEQLITEKYNQLSLSLSGLKNKNEALLLQKQLEVFDSTWRNEMELKRSQAASNYASASESSAHAALYRVEHDLKSIEFDVNLDTKDVLKEKVKSALSKEFLGNLKDSHAFMLEIERIIDEHNWRNDSHGNKVLDVILEYIKRKVNLNFGASVR